MHDLDAASALLDVTTEAELDRFLHGLVADATGRSVPAGAVHELAGVLRDTAELTVPTLAVVLGVRAPRAAAAARTYDVEPEGMSAEDRDHEIARRFVLFADAAARRLAHGEPDAVRTAAREFAPGLLRKTARPQERSLACSKRTHWQRSSSTENRSSSRRTTARPRTSTRATSTSRTKAKSSSCR